MSVLALISGHGFGHWTRSEAVLSRLAERGPVHVRTNLRARILQRRAEWSATRGELDLGPGVAQEGPLRVDVPGTRARWVAHLERWDETLAHALADARALGVQAVYADVPPLAFALARELGVPSVACANFTWSWILRPLCERDPGLLAVVERLAAAEDEATHVIALPGGGGLERLGPPALSTLLARPATRSRAEARALLPRPPGHEERPLALLSFGGFGDQLDLSAAAANNPDWAFLSFAEPATPPPSNLSLLPHDHGVSFQDLVLGADAVISKPGYGIISECVAAERTPLVLCDGTPEFREHAVLLEWATRFLPLGRISRAQLQAGDWSQALAAARAATPPEPAPGNGLEQIVEFVAGLLPPR